MTFRNPNGPFRYVLSWVWSPWSRQILRGGGVLWLIMDRSLIINQSWHVLNESSCEETRLWRLNNCHLVLPCHSILQHLDSKSQINPPRFLWRSVSWCSWVWEEMVAAIWWASRRRLRWPGSDSPTTRGWWWGSCCPSSLLNPATNTSPVTGTERQEPRSLPHWWGQSWKIHYTCTHVNTRARWGSRV